MSRMHEATEQILQANHPDAWQEVAELRSLLRRCEQALTRYANPTDAAHWPPIPPRQLLRDLALTLANINKTDA